MKPVRIVLTSLVFAPVLMLTSCGALFEDHGKPGNVAAATGAQPGHLVGSANDQGYYNGQPLPYGRMLGGGLVESPYKPHNTIDTRGMPHGAVVEDPSTGRRFIKP